MGKLSANVCEVDMCTGCMLCVDMCPVGAISIHADMEAYNAVIDQSLCVDCGRCRGSCPQNAQPVFKKQLEWHQGWSRESSVREGSSSGGMASEIAARFIQSGGEVCTCVFDKGNFIFRFFDRVEALSAAAGSKYVKSNPKGVYSLLADKLKNGRKVLMIALPCQIAAAQRSIQAAWEGNFYTIDLVCHGTPSPDVLRSYFRQKGLALEELKEIRFRTKEQFNLLPDYQAVETKITDEYTYAFLCGMTYTENCYHCHYARLDRVSDLTLGDSWGSELPESERNKGISLILCQTEKGRELLGMANAELRPVDIERAVEFNQQLKEPMDKTASGRRFMTEIKKGRSFQMALLYAEPKRAVKNMIKKYCPLIRTEHGGVHNNIFALADRASIAWEAKKDRDYSFQWHNKRGNSGKCRADKYIYVGIDICFALCLSRGRKE